MKAPPIWPAGQLYHLKGDTVCSSNEWQPSHTSQTGRQVIFLVKEPIFSSCWPCRAQNLACPPSNWHTPTPICGPADIGIPKYKYIYSYTNTNTQMKMSYFKVAGSWDISAPFFAADICLQDLFVKHILWQIFSILIESHASHRWEAKICMVRLRAREVAPAVQFSVAGTT